MNKHDELYDAIKEDRKQAGAATFNQELLKMYKSRRKNESGKRTTKMVKQNGKKRKHRCRNELNDSDYEDDDDDEDEIQTESTMEPPTFAYNNYSEVACNDHVKKETITSVAV